MGDLEEGYRRRHAQRGALGAKLWYWIQVLRLPYGELGRAVRGLQRARAGRVRGMAEGGARMGRFGEELKIALRTLARRPGYALVVMATLASSIGAATLIFSALEAVIARTLPYPDADRVVTLYGLNEAWREGENEQLRAYWDRYPISLDQLDAAAAAPGIVAAGGAGTGEAVLRTDLGARQVALASVAGELFEALGVAPRLGRFPSAEELASSAPIAVISHRLWTEAFARDPGAIGRTLSVDGTPRTVIGVMPEGFFFPTPEQELWVPLPEGLRQDGRAFPVLIGVGRIAPEATIDDVSAAVDVSARRLGDPGPRTGAGMRAVSRREEALGQVERGLSLFMGAVVLVVVLAAVNLANLVLARASHRRGELAVRRALGGGRVAVAWTVLAEVLLLCVAGGVVGVLAAALLLQPFMGALAAVDLLRGAEARLNATVLGFALVTTVAAALGAGLPIAWRSSRSLPAAALRAGRRGGASRATRRTQRLLLTTESGLAFVLLAGAILLVRSVAAIAAVDPGYEIAGVDYVTLEPSSDRYPDSERRLALYASVVEEAGRRTGAPATLADPLPSAGTSNVEPVRAEEADESSEVAATRVGPGFFAVVGLPLLHGRGFTAADGPDDPAVVVVDERLAHHLAPDGDAVGRTVLVGRGDDERRATVVGVAADARMLAVALEPQEHLYLPMAQFSTGSAAVLARDGSSGGSVLRDAVLAVDPELVLGRTGTLEGASWRIMAPIRTRAALLAALALLALLLASVGIFGVVAHVVEERTREIGVRIALGALPAGESLRVTRSFLVTVGTGTLVGLGIALFASRLLESMLYEVQPLDPLSYVAAALFLPALGAFAAWLPARRAARVDPIEVLNRE